jgi:hypothetical protein
MLGPGTVAQNTIFVLRLLTLRQWRRSAAPSTLILPEGIPMRDLKSYRPSPALVVSAVALSVALGGTSYAAIVLPANSVGTKQLK